VGHKCCVVLACLWNKFTSLLNNISINYLHLSIKWDSMVSEEIVVISYTVRENNILLVVFEEV